MENIEINVSRSFISLLYAGEPDAVPDGPGSDVATPDGPGSDVAVDWAVTNT